MTQSRYEVSPEEEIADVSMGKPHVVLLGAGASRAAFPQGDANGRKLPLMLDFVEHVPVGELLSEAGFSNPVKNFEAAYSSIASDPDKAEIRARLEEVIYQYFDGLRQPPTPTLYDHLLLSLRPKDVIATFNWDPFLIQAVRRNRVLSGQVPALLFLHGNVMAGYCAKDDIHGLKGARCSRCGGQFVSASLLYPIAQKDYRRETMISKAWDFLEKSLKKAFMFTVFGYSAPTSDVSAMTLLKGAWGSGENRNMEQMEFIDIRKSDDIVGTWGPFIHTHHHEIHDDFYQSWIAKHPRRTGEAYWNQYYEAKFISDNLVPKDAAFGDLWDWYGSLFAAEKRAQRADA